MSVQNILIRPLLTEKTSDLTESNNIYTFLVKKSSNKYQIKQAVELMFDVKVLSVRSSITAGKTKRSGKTTKKSTSKKKAYVKIADGQKIEIFKGI